MTNYTTKTTSTNRRLNNTQSLSTNWGIANDEDEDAATEKCQFCNFERFTTVLMPEGHKHFAALRCGSCDGFHKWLEAPHTKEKREKRRVKISDLLKSTALSSWERGFLESVQGRKKLSPKQLEVLDRISGKVGGLN